jgi:hypothetical protein
LAGCGVAGYEKQMQDAEVRIRRFDDENRLLGDPLIIPTPPKEQPIALFLRPPKGVVNTSKKDEIPYHYPTTTGVCTDVYIAVGDGPKEVEKLIEDRFNVSALPWQSVTVNPPNRQPIKFGSVEFNDSSAPANAPAVYQVYIHMSVGVVFRFLTANREAARPSVQMSMETFADGGDAFKAWADFNKRGAH